MQRAIAAVVLVVTGPLYSSLAALVRLTSRGPAFHRATRIRPGGTFTLYKLRTMRAGSRDEWARRDGRMATRASRRLGRFLRRTKLDESPQLWNVVRGDMALVGPRPRGSALRRPDRSASRPRLRRLGPASPAWTALRLSP